LSQLRTVKINELLIHAALGIGPDAVMAKQALGLAPPTYRLTLRPFWQPLRVPFWQQGTRGVASIIPFLRPRSDFDDEATRIMGEAFDAACKEIRDGEPRNTIHEAIAKRIIDAARRGERDPVRLRDIALAALGIGRH
jgi:hypothetical protein